MKMTKHFVSVGMLGAMVLGGRAWGQAQVTRGFLTPTAEELARTSLPG